MMQLLEGLRAEEGKESISVEDAKYLCSFCINNLQHFTEKEAKQLCDDDTTLFLFANRAPKENFNRWKLFTQHSEDNPVAVIKACTSKNGKMISWSKHFDEEDTPNSTSICHDAKVQITGKNILPGKGLYNGSIGVVKDIVFSEGHSPNNGDFPEYVLVDFCQYQGEDVIEEGNESYIPIVPVEVCYKF